MRLHVGAVCVLVGSQRLHNLLTKRLGVVERGLSEPQRHPARPDKVVGCDGGRQGQVLALGRVDGPHELGVQLGDEHHPVCDGVRILGTQDRAHDRSQRQVPPLALGQGRRLRGAQLAHAAAGQIRLGPGDQGKGRVVGLADGFPPGHETVVHEDQRRRRREASHCVADGLRERQPGRHIGDRCNLASERRRYQRSAVFAIGERKDGTWMGVNHEGVGKYGVGQGLDGGAARGRAQGVASELACHDLVGHGRQLHEPLEIAEIERDEIAGLHIGQRHARGLDEERRLRFAKRIHDRSLARGIAAAMHGQVGLHTNEMRGIRQQRDWPCVRVTVAGSRRFGFGPSILHQRFRDSLLAVL